MMRYLLLFLLLIPPLALAVPSKPTVSVSTGVSLSGTGFGTKTVAAPLKFFNFNADTDGETPAGWSVHPGRTGLLTSTAESHTGKSIDGSVTRAAANAEIFKRTKVDLDSTIPLGGKLYISAWMFLDHTGSTASGFNWKGPLISSSATLSTGNDVYWENAEGEGVLTSNVATGFGGFYAIDSRYYGFGYSNRWFNPAATIQYSSGGYAVVGTCVSGNNGWASDSFTLGSWQRVEWVLTPSSSAGAADGSVTVRRVGKSATSIDATGCTTHGDTSDLWRYVSFPQGITNIYDGELTLKMNFDDIYIDNSQARVELCDSATWANRTHCEVQPSTAWGAGAITTGYNRGSFAIGSTAYFYVVDAAGAVSPASDPFTVAAAGTAPTTTPNKASGRYATTQQLAFTSTAGTTKYCFGAGCTPTAAYSAPIKILQNLARQTVRYQSTDGSGAETVKESVFLKQRRR